jgi:hypothetical protein
MEFDGLAEGWEVWSLETRHAVLTYRPDVFDTHAYPAACLPTIHVTKGRRGRRPGRPDPDPDDPWYVTLALEPEIEADERTCETRAAAQEQALALAAAFADGKIDYRGCYQVPRPAYVDRLDELTGRESSDA